MIEAGKKGPAPRARGHEEVANCDLYPTLAGSAGARARGLVVAMHQTIPGNGDRAWPNQAAEPLH